MAQQLGIAHGGDAVADAFGAQHQRFPNGFRSAAFTGVRGEMQAGGFGKRENILEPFGRPAFLAAADADGHHPAILARRRQARHVPSRLHAELAHRVQDPADFHRRAVRGVVNGVENGAEFLLLPQHHARRNDDFGVADVLRGQPLEQPVRDQGVILRPRQPRHHRAEGFQEGVEVRVTVERAQLLKWRGRVQFVQRFGIHRPFQVQVQLGLGQLRGKILHTRLLLRFAYL